MRARLDLSTGRLRLLVEDAVLPPVFFCCNRPDPDDLRRARRAGIRVFLLPLTADYHLYGLAPDVWLEPGRREHGPQIERLSEIADAVPDALFLPRLHTCSPPWWDERHPEELTVWEDGARARPLEHGSRKDRVPSPGSELWRRASAKNLRLLVEALQDSEFGDRLVGYLPCSLSTEEWFLWGIQEGYLGDYAPCVEARFRDWLLERHGDDEGLARAWGREVTAATAAIPPFEARIARDALRFRDPVLRRDVIDFGLFLSDLVADHLLETADALRAAAGPERIVGAFYGYLLELGFHRNGLQAGGHLALDRVARSPALDFLASPLSYGDRRVGRGRALSMVPTAALSRRGRAFLHEIDERTHRARERTSRWRPFDAVESAAALRRAHALALTGGEGLWLFDMGGGWYDDPLLDRVLADLLVADRRARTLPRRPVAEVAVLLDEASFMALESPPEQWIALVHEQVAELARLGAPHEVLLLDDLEAAGPHAFVIVPCLLTIEPERRARLLERLSARERTVLWIGGPGFSDGRSIDPAHAEALTGMRIAIPPTPQSMLVEGTLDGTTALYGARHWHETTPVVEDDRATVLGRYIDSGRVALAERRVGPLRSVYSAAPTVCASLLRALARGAGVHLYLDTDDQLFADDRFVAVHTRSAGSRRLRMPGADRLVEVHREVELRPEDDGAFRLDLPAGETALLFRGDLAAWRAIGI